MLIVSGSDLTGKSTFVKECVRILQERGLQHTAAHLSRPAPHCDYYDSYLEMVRVNVVYDRFLLDTLAYRQHDDHPCELTPLKYELVEAATRAHCGMQVILSAQPWEIKERFEVKGDPLYTLEHILKVNESFIAMTAGRTVTMRGELYWPRIDLCGSVTGMGVNRSGLLLTPTTACDVYCRRLAEFQSL